MIPKGCVVHGFRAVFSPLSVRAYRHYGFLVVEDFLPAPLARQLTATCNAAVQQRGDDIFPGLDAQHRQGATLSLNSKLNPLEAPGGAADTGAPSPPASSTSLGFGEAPLPPDLQRELEASERHRHVETRTKKLYLTLKSQRAVDRAYRRLTKARKRYNAYRRLRSYVTPEEEMAGDMTEERIRELQSKYTYEDFQHSFQHYRDSGLMENEIRRDHHINDAMAFMQGWPRTWCWLWYTSPELKALAVSVTGAVGQLVGEASGYLAGEVVLRVYSDSATEATPLSNATPLGFTGSTTNFAHAHALCAQLGLEQPNPTQSGAATVVVPGSHHVVRSLSLDGTELDRFQYGGIFDAGSMVRGLPEVSHLPVVELPPLAPGAALFFNNYLLMGTQANLTGAGRDAAGSAARGPATHMMNYALSLIPDRCVFDGKLNSWASRDSHGPLYSWKRGQLLTDDAAFPVIHRALDVE
ncbi:hypothetical protein LSCM1_05827 [Leishmania martiniquensis]|uniref:Uncharacterized protein n=1 Tax=Leishmania martiniquensis TaxID=1580590 RepID=A0A836HD66_9TRYP|nr:hypothetical protein LSCM1_05827 [Leishmania martiniquensis]